MSDLLEAMQEMERRSYESFVLSAEQGELLNITVDNFERRIEEFRENL